MRESVEGPMSEFYGDVAPAAGTDPADDPVLTIRISPPDTQERRLDLNTPRAVKVDHHEREGWALVDPNGSCEIRGQLWVRYDQVADWPVQHPLTVSTAQRLTRPDTGTRSAGGRIRESDEDDRLFR